jgi:excisionase family DNA binding protein
MDFDDRPFWRPKDLAELLQVSSSQIYRLIEDQQLRSVRVGERAVRVPGASVAAFLGASPAITDEELTGPASLAERIDRFAQQHGRTPEQFVQAWRTGEIGDTAQSTEIAIEALALREAAALERSDVASSPRLT